MLQLAEDPARQNVSPPGSERLTHTRTLYRYTERMLAVTRINMPFAAGRALFMVSSIAMASSGLGIRSAVAVRESLAASREPVA